MKRLSLHPWLLFPQLPLSPLSRSLPYLFVLLVGLLGDLLGLSELRLERGRPVVLHVGLVLEGLAYPTQKRLVAQAKGKTQLGGTEFPRFWAKTEFV